MSLTNSSSMASFWTMVNQVQLFFLLLLTRAFIPIDVQNVITGAKFALNIAPYIHFQSIEFINSAISEFDFSLSDQNLDLLNIESDSSIFNTSFIIIAGFIVVPLHLTTALLFKLTSTYEPEGRWKLIKQIIIIFIKKLFNFLTFGLYVRYIFETNQFVLISWIYEANKLNIFDIKKIISLIFAICMLSLCFGLVLLTTSLSLSSYEVSKENHNKLGEIYCGVKMQK